jgi:hypothetical protein
MGIILKYPGCSNRRTIMNNSTIMVNNGITLMVSFNINKIEPKECYNVFVSVTLTNKGLLKKYICHVKDVNNNDCTESFIPMVHYIRDILMTIPGKSQIIISLAMMRNALCDELKEFDMPINIKFCQLVELDNLIKED